MKIIRQPAEFQHTLKSLRDQGISLGLVPTMGALHEGHLSLVARSRSENRMTAASIFVNPMQFGPNEDFGSYPRTFEEDCRKLESAGVDFLFFPDMKDIYPEGFCSAIEVNTPLAEKLCGAKRPGHFRGVTTIVGMLFHLAQPHRAYFGLKDYQQYLIIKKMAKDLFFPVEVCPVEIFRESDGLAMSSRNRYLSLEERKAAPVLYQSLKEAEKAVLSGERSMEALKEIMRRTISSCVLTKIDYIEILDAETLHSLETLEPGKQAVAALAVFFGKARLIDNLILKG